MFEVSISGYYSYLRRKEAKDKTEQEYGEKIRTLFNEGRGTYGIDRICGY